jgi:hypothetical protein
LLAEEVMNTISDHTDREYLISVITHLGGWIGDRSERLFSTLRYVGINGDLSARIWSAASSSHVAQFSSISSTWLMKIWSLLTLMLLILLLILLLIRLRLRLKLSLTAP